MAWYWLVAIVIVALFALLFVVYITNADQKMVETIYNKTLAYHSKQDKEEKI